MSKKRATTNHPTYKKVDKLMQYAEELGIEIRVESYSTYVRDKQFPKEEWELHDLEEEHYNHSQITYIPYGLEFKLICEVDE